VVIGVHQVRATGGTESDATMIDEFPSSMSEPLGVDFDRERGELLEPDDINSFVATQFATEKLRPSEHRLIGFFVQDVALLIVFHSSSSPHCFPACFARMC